MAGKRFKNVADDPMIQSSLNAVVKMLKPAAIGDDHPVSGEHREAIAKMGIGSIQMMI